MHREKEFEQERNITAGIDLSIKTQIPCRPGGQRSENSESVIYQKASRSQRWTTSSCPLAGG